MKKLKIIFVGTPDMALVCLDGLLENNFDIAGVVPPSKINSTYSFFKGFVQNRNLNFVEFNNSPNEKEYIEKIKRLNADIGVVCSYNSKLSNDFLNTTRLGYINCHPSLLPEYRGGMPYFHIIKNNEKTSGITLHFMDDEYDTGDIIYQKEFELLPFETLGTLFNRTNFMINDALIKVLSDIQNDIKIKRIPQEKSIEFKKAPVVETNFRINWNNSIDEIDALTRACNPFYSVYCAFRGLNIKIIKTNKIPKNHNIEFGKIFKSSEDELLVAAKGGFISIEILQPASWGIFNTSDFYNIFKPEAGEYLR